MEQSFAERAVEMLEEIYRLGMDESVDDLEDAIPWGEMFDLLEEYRGPGLDVSQKGMQVTQ